MLTTEVIGNIGYDAVVKEINGRYYTAFSVAHSFKKRNSFGEMEDTTQWVSVLWYGDEHKIAPYLRKGAKVYVRGRQRTNVIIKDNGSPKVGINLDATDVFLCSSHYDEDDEDNE